MEEGGLIVGRIDLAQVTLYLFWAFFAGLIIYLQRESNREGFPLESDPPGLSHDNGLFFRPPPKSFKLPHNEGTAYAPTPEPHPEPALNSTRIAVAPGSAYAPNGDDPMTSGVGPGSIALRADHADLTHAGDPKIAPMKAMGGLFEFAKEDKNPIGFTVIGADGEKAGEVSDVWIDREESLIRYFEVKSGKNAGGPKVLLPHTFAEVKPGRETIYVDSITGSQMKAVPQTKASDRVTRLEEEKITAYFGAGTLYAWPGRSEPWA